MSEPAWGFYEFFAGGGMARLALGNRWRCLFSNEICEKKARAYRMNFGPSPELTVGDVWKLRVDDLPSGATLAWASFPCQDLSLAGNGLGLEGARSGTFVAFWRLMDCLAGRGRRVPIIVLENVAGTLTSKGGRDFATILDSVVRSGYRAGAMLIDAVHFLPQSRPRLFIVAVNAEIAIPAELVGGAPSDPWHPPRLRSAHDALPQAIRRRWLWWKLPPPPHPARTLTDVIEGEPDGVEWHTPEATARLLSLMSQKNLEKVREAQARGRRIVGTVYKRIRFDEHGAKTQRAEARFDQVGGCLRTPAGGSSRQIILVVDGDSVRSRLLSAREAARLMGLPDTYRLPPRYSDAYHVAGDGLAIPAVEWLEAHLLQPLARGA